MASRPRYPEDPTLVATAATLPSVWRVWCSSISRSTSSSRPVLWQRAIPLRFAFEHAGLNWRKHVSYDERYAAHGRGYADR